jgi:hypothetical protein
MGCWFDPVHLARIGRPRLLWNKVALKGLAALDMISRLVLFCRCKCRYIGIYHSFFQDYIHNILLEKPLSPQLLEKGKRENIDLVVLLWCQLSCNHYESEILSVMEQNLSTLSCWHGLESNICLS